MSLWDINRICYGCVNVLRIPGSICHYCGWDNSVRRAEWGRLPAMALKDGRFFIGRPIGVGGFGVTYLGRDLLAGQGEDARRAIKEFFPAGIAVRGGDGLSVRPMGAEYAGRFQRRRARAMIAGERMARVGSQVNNVVRAFTCFSENNTVYTVMEYIDGDTLTDIVRREGPMKWRKALKRLRPVLTALREMHARGVYHMDISPDNIMLRRNPDGSRGEPVILDFGASVEVGTGEATRTRSAAIVHDGYTPPEQYVNNSGTGADAARMDEYAVCATLYYAVTGQAPTGSQARSVGGRIRPFYEHGIRTSTAFERVLNRGMDMRAEKRYASIAALTAALNRSAHGGLRAAALCAAACAAVVLAMNLGLPGVPNDGAPLGGGPTNSPAPAKDPIARAAQVVVPTPTATPTATPRPLGGGNLVRDTDYPALARAAETCAYELNYDNREMISDTPMLNHPQARRKDIATVTFYPTLFGAPDDAWDVSEGGDSRVMAWLTPNGSLYDLSIAGAGGVKLLDPEGESGLFAGCSNLESVDFNRCVDFSGRENLSKLFWYCTSLKRVDFAGVCTASATNMAHMFYECKSLESLDVTGFDTSKVTMMQGMFSSCSGLTSLDVSGFDTSKAMLMYSMFHSCSGLAALDVSGFDTSQVQDMWCMFEGCSGLTALDVSLFDTSQVTDMYSMFSGCSGLTALDVSGFNTSQVTTMWGMFYGCSSLTALDVSGFDTSKVTNMGFMFNGCKSLKTIGRDPKTFGHNDTSDMFYNCDALEGK